MANTIASLKNVNLLSKTQYDAIESPATDELWAVDVESDSEFKSTIVGWGKPDYSAEISISSPYTPTQNGFISLCVTGAYTHVALNEDGVDIINQYDDTAGANQQNILRLIPVTRGKTYSWTYINGTLTYAKFAPSFGG